MKYFKYLIIPSFTLLFACGSDDGRACINCSSDQTEAFELCREPDGTASVNGENTGVNYDTYINDLQDSGVNCGG